MNCGVDDDEHELLEVEPTAAPAMCGSGQPCSDSACGQGSRKRDSRPSTSGQRCSASQGSWRRDDEQGKSLACMKCKTAPAVVLVRQREPLCQACLEAGVSGKVRALKSNKLLLPRDRVAVAFSGGFSSQTLLCNVLAMRTHGATARKERGKIEFELEVIHVNEAAAYGLDVDAAAAHGRAVAAAAQRCGGSPAASSAAVPVVHVVPLSDVFLWLHHEADSGHRGRRRHHQQQQAQGAETKAKVEQDGASAAAELAAAPRAGDCESAAEAAGEGVAGHGPGRHGAGSLRVPAEAEGEGQWEVEAEVGGAARDARLQALLQSVPDPTGREDLVRHLREQLLAAVAARLGATKVLGGATATTLAARVISDTAKGRGYALPGGIQLIDARGWVVGRPAVLQPMREVTMKEAVFFCRLRGLQPVQLPYIPTGPRRTVNSLSASFVDALQANLPSTIFTILRTAAALKPFPFNALEALAPPTAVASAGDGGRDAAAPGLEDDATGRYGDEGVGENGGMSRAVLPSGCVLCRAPLTSREQEANAAAAARSLRARGHGLESCTSPENDSASAGAGGGSAAAVAHARVVMGTEDVGVGDEGDDDDAPFCGSCRNQILFIPEQSAGAGDSTAFAGISPTCERGLSTTLPLLPARFRR